jgi:uncharacterized protein with PIN domain
MANIPGLQPELLFCPSCKAELRNVPRSEMKAKKYRRKDGAPAPETHINEYRDTACKNRFEINQDR